MYPSFKIRLLDRLQLFIFSILGAFLGSNLATQNMELATMPELRTNKKAGAAGTGALAGSGKKSLGEIILFVLILFIVFLFATSGIIANSNIQTQLKNGAYYGGLFASVVVILIVLAFIL